MTTVIVPFLAALAALAARCRRRQGQTLVEYALVLAVLTVVLVAVFSLLSAKIIVVFSAITNILDTAQAGSH
jgi:Flp pilus assembly pilin Flp